MKGLMKTVYRNWLANRVVYLDPRTVEIQGTKRELLAACDEAVVNCVASTFEVSREKAERIVQSDMFNLWSSTVHLCELSGATIGRFPTSCSCVRHNAYIEVNSEKAAYIVALQERIRSANAELDTVREEAYAYFFGACRTYKQLKATHPRLYSSLLDAYGLHDASSTPLSTVNSGFAQFVNSLSGDRNGA